MPSIPNISDRISLLRQERAQLIEELSTLDEQIPLTVRWWQFRTKHRLKKIYPVFSEKVARINEIGDRLDQMVMINA